MVVDKARATSESL